MTACANQKMIGNKTATMTNDHPPSFGRNMIKINAAIIPLKKALKNLFILITNKTTLFSTDKSKTKNRVSASVASQHTETSTILKR